MHDDLFACLLRPKPEEDRFAKLLKLRHELRLPHAVVVIAGPPDKLPGVGREVRGRALRCALVEAVDDMPPHLAVIVPLATPNQLVHVLDAADAPAAKHGCLVIPETPVLGPRALQASYQRATLYAAVAWQVGLSGPRVEPIMLTIYRALGGLDTEEQGVMLAPIRPILALGDSHRDAYMDTLNVWQQEGTAPQVGRALHVHANTVRYRMERVQEMTGLDLRNPMHRLRLDLAVLLYNFQRGARGALSGAVR